MSTNPLREQINANLVAWYALRVSNARREIAAVAKMTQELVGKTPSPVALTRVHDEMLELRAAVEALSNAADDLERGAATLRDEGQP